MIRIVGFSLLGVFAGLASADWPQFLGPNRDSAATLSEGEEAGIIDSLPADGSAILWRRPVGSGFAGPVVSGDRVILFHRVDARIRVEALALQSGEPQWVYSAPTDYRDDFGFDDGPRASPTVAGGRVYCHGADGWLRALDLKDGKLLWEQDLRSGFEAAKGFFGRACAPLVVGDQVILQVGGTSADGQGAGIVAFSAKDGSTLWTATNHEAGYASPVLLDEGAGVACLTRSGLVILDPMDGKIRFEHPYRAETHASVNAATPLRCGNDSLLLSACYDVGASLWMPGPDGKFVRKWRETDRLDCHYATPIFFGGTGTEIDPGIVVGFHGRQESGQELRGIDPGTGEVLWREPDLGNGMALRVGAEWIAVNDDGELLVGRVSREGIMIRIREQILKRGHRSAPAFSRGIFLCRDGESLLAIRLSR